MTNIHTVRGSTSPLVHSITHSVAQSNGHDLIMPDGRWDLIFVRHNQKQTAYLMSSPTLTAVAAPYAAGQESLVVTFKTGTFVNTGSELDKRGFYALPVMGRSFSLGQHRFKIPTFDNADNFVEQLKSRGVLGSDEVVAKIAQNQPRAQTDRTVQRHFRQVTGMSPYYYMQIKRALAAADRLRQGLPAVQVAHELGYSDQAHMSKSLKHILGQSPSEFFIC